MARGDALTDLNTPQGIGTLPDGHLAVEDWRNRRIVILDAATGSALLAFGGVGGEPGRFINTSGLYVDRRGSLLVADQQLHRVQKFDAQGKLLAVIGNNASAHFFSQDRARLRSMLKAIC
jgi:tripartite motif-containing protein 71